LSINAMVIRPAQLRLLREPGDGFVMGDPMA